MLAVSEEFAAAMIDLALLRKPVDNFFDNVTVNCDDADLRRPSRVRMGLNLRHEAPDHPLDRFHQAGFGNTEGRHAFPYLNQKTQRLYT